MSARDKAEKEAGESRIKKTGAHFVHVYMSGTPSSLPSKTRRLLDLCPGLTANPAAVTLMPRRTICTYRHPLGHDDAGHAAVDDSYTTAKVAAMAGVHRDTLLRWLRAGSVAEPSRDRRGWRVFTASQAAAIKAFATGARPRTAPEDADVRSRLSALDWDFASAKTDYLTHGLHPYPAKFIPQIPNALIQELSSVGDTIVDPFCGSGTTLLEALQLKRNALGIDANPLAVMISRAKTTPLTDAEFEEVAAHQDACEALLLEAESRNISLFGAGGSFSSTAWRPERKVCEFWFLPHVVDELAELRRLIDQVRHEAARILCQSAFAAIIVAVSKQDSDTRYVRREKKVGFGDTVRRYLGQLMASLTAVREMTDLLEERFRCRVVEANILDGPETGAFDLVVTSPPYPNAYSYHLYHRTRLLWLGRDPSQFKELEIGSHRKYSAKGPGRATPDTFLREFRQIFAWLQSRLREGRYACFVIGNSTIAGKSVDNASLLCAAGEAEGFEQVACMERNIPSKKKSFNPKIGKIRTEKILVLRKGRNNE